MFDKLFKRFRKKDASGDSFGQFFGFGPASWTRRDYLNLSREGFEKNSVAFRCISQIATSVADIPVIIEIDDNEVEDGQLYDLIRRPNPGQSYKSFMHAAVTHRLISGNTYIHGNIVADRKSAVRELTLMRPDRVTIQTNDWYIPKCYVYAINNKVIRYDIDPETLLSEVLQIKTINPTDDLYGLSPIAVAAMSIDQHNQSSEWNKNLLQNSATPRGVLSMKDRNDNAPPLTREQREDITNSINEKFSGARNAGRIPVVGFDMQWQSMGMSPTDMDWINGRATSARDICLAFGYPAQLLGMPEGSTFNNVDSAKLSLYEDTVVPLAQSILDELSYWLSKQYQQNIELCIDIDKIPALQPRRETARTSARNDVLAGIITVNEARDEMDYEPMPGGYELMTPANKLPLGFDTTKDPVKYREYLEREGFTKADAQSFTRLAFLDSQDV